MPRHTVESFAGGDQSWLLNTHGLENAITVTLNPANFTAGTHYKDGVFPSGLALNIADLGDVKPFTGVAGEQLGFLVTDQATDGVSKLAVPALVHGAVKADRLPVALPGTIAAGLTAAFTLTGYTAKAA